MNSSDFNEKYPIVSIETCKTTYKMSAHKSWRHQSQCSSVIAARYAHWFLQRINSQTIITAIMNVCKLELVLAEINDRSANSETVSKSKWYKLHFSSKKRNWFYTNTFCAGFFLCYGKSFSLILFDCFFPSLSWVARVREFFSFFVCLPAATEPEKCLTSCKYPGSRVHKHTCETLERNEIDKWTTKFNWNARNEKRIGRACSVAVDRFEFILIDACDDIKITRRCQWVWTRDKLVSCTHLMSHTCWAEK